MEKKSLTFWAMLTVILALAGGSARAVEYTHIWVDQGTGINHPDTPGTPNEPFKSITYALARAEYLGWPEPWHVHIGPGVYDADLAKPAPEREIFPIQLRQDMIFEAGDVNDPNTAPNDPDSRIIDGRHLVEGFTSLLYGNDLTGVEIRGLTFRNMDHSTGNGGAIELIECSGLIENCIVENCTAQSGGGLWLSPHSGPAVPFDFIGCQFIGNTATSGSGGGFQVTDSLIGNITECTFNENSVYVYIGGGGGFCINGTLDGMVNNCTFSDNSVSNSHYGGYGAGFYIATSMDGSITECNFIYNTASGSGGANYGGGFRIGDTLNGNITSCHFTGNSANAQGGSCSAYGGGFAIGTLTGTINWCTFNQNLDFSVCAAFAGGGGFHIDNLSNDIRHCTFSQNSSNCDGGGFSVHSMGGCISNCNFSENEASNKGSGFRINNLTGDIEGCTFSGNVGSTAGFHVDGTLTGDVRRCEFDNGKYMLGNYAMYLNGTFDGTMENCRFYDFTDNTIRLLSDSGTTAGIRNCLFVVAPEAIGDVSGWAVRTSQKTMLSNNTIVGPGLDPNYSPSALYFDFDTQANNSEIFNNIIIDTEKAIVVDPAVDMPITYNQFYNVDEIVCLGEQCLGNDIWWLEWNLNNFRHNDYGDPLFFAHDAVYHIQETSPCVDAGDPNYVAEANETDIDGQPRIDIDTVDIGADEYYTYTLTADIYHDGIVNFLDFAVLGLYWQQNEPLADIAPPGGDGIINFLDLGVFVDEWLLTEPWY